MLSYRTPASFSSKFKRKLKPLVADTGTNSPDADTDCLGVTPSERFEVEGYLMYQVRLATAVFSHFEP